MDYILIKIKTNTVLYLMMWKIDILFRKKQDMQEFVGHAPFCVRKRKNVFVFASVRSE